MLVFICFLFTISAAFEYQLITDDKFVDRRSGEACEIGVLAHDENDDVSVMEKTASKEQFEYTGKNNKIRNQIKILEPNKDQKFLTKKQYFSELELNSSYDTVNEMKMLSTQISYPANPMEDNTISTISNQPSALRSARAAEDDFAANASDESASNKINATLDASGENVDGLAVWPGLAIKGSGANISSRCHKVSEKCRTFFFIKFSMF